MKTNRIQTMGRIAALRGKSLTTNPYDPRSAKGKRWRKGFDQARSEPRLQYDSPAITTFVNAWARPR